MKNYETWHWACQELMGLGYLAEVERGAWIITPAGHQAATQRLMGMRTADQMLLVMHIGSAVPEESTGQRGIDAR